ncbi:hypothetical protein Q73A0000_01325 [Kaistella flava (ex Peng et al. 2021)]|uniref:Uncharacterized protein n=1 Tax=Kaistella flava (ex Peng et al. 2021) TaxID=2038776 RepID=A0A7M2Y6U5_9FLAO|nr:hypothetical protein [Kaistella flava (ex Peng et al. 2021)]QOW09083.1 hypothetical protein Q73A0000_01325 [Kaistella flava (ex Peng et al. 2021)]
MEDFLTIYVAAYVISLMIFYFVIKSAVKNAIKETRNVENETDRLLKSILIKLGGNLPELTKIDNDLKNDFNIKKKVLNKKMTSDRTYNAKIKELEIEFAQKEYDLKSKL